MRRSGILCLIASVLCAAGSVRATDVYQPPDREPSADEVLILELMNRFRADPPAEADRLGFKDEAGAEMRQTKPLPPLVMNLNLLDAARKHNYYMILNSLTHDEEPGKPGFYGEGPDARCAKSGYTGRTMGENCFRDAGGAYDSHAGFAHSHGHRGNMASGAREAGTGAVPHDGRIAVTHVFGGRNVPRMAGGVVYQDSNGNKFYDPGEGFGGVRISAGDGSSTTTWRSGGYALDLKSARAVVLTAEFLGQKFTKSYAAGGENIKFDVIVPEALISAAADKLFAAVDAAGAPESPKWSRAVLTLYMEAKGLRLDADRRKRFDELTRTVGPDLEANLKAVRDALENLDVPVFAKVLDDSRKPYAGGPADNWFRDAATIAGAKLRVIGFERQNAAQKISAQQKHMFAAEIEAVEKQLLTTAFSSEFNSLVARARNPGAPPPPPGAAGPALAPAAPGPAAPAAKTPAAARPPAEAKAPAAKADVPVAAQALAPWVGKLRQRVIDGVKAGQRPSVFLGLMGGKEVSVRIASADNNELLAEIDGGRLPVAWARLDKRTDMLNLAKAFARDDAATDRLLIAVFLLANGLSEDAEREFGRALELKLPDSAVMEWRQLKPAPK